MTTQDKIEREDAVAAKLGADARTHELDPFHLDGAHLLLDRGLEIGHPLLAHLGRDLGALRRLGLRARLALLPDRGHLAGEAHEEVARRAAAEADDVSAGDAGTGDRLPQLAFVGVRALREGELDLGAAREVDPGLDAADRDRRDADQDDREREQRRDAGLPEKVELRVRRDELEQFFSPRWTAARPAGRPDTARRAGA